MEVDVRGGAVTSEAATAEALPASEALARAEPLSQFESFAGAEPCEALDVGSVTEAAVSAVVRVAEPTLAPGETAAFGPAELPRDLLERRGHGGVLLGGDGAGDAGADLFHGDAEALLREGAGLGEGPALLAALDPAELQ